MNADPETSKWKPAHSRLMAILNSIQAQVDAERRLVDTMNEFYRQFISVPTAAEETKENQASTPQMDITQAKQKLGDFLEKANTVLAKAKQLRHGDSGDCTSKNERHSTKIKSASTMASKKIDDRQHDKPQAAARTAAPKQTPRSRSRSVVTVRKVSIIRDQPRSTSQSRCQRQRRAVSPSKKSDTVAYREMLSVPEVRAQLREFSALVDEARKCAAKETDCPERQQFLSVYDAEEAAADNDESSKSESFSMLTSPAFPSREEFRREFRTYIEKKRAALDKCILDFCAESILPLLESTPCPNQEYTAVVQTFYGIICNKGRRFPAFVDCEP
ncbi:uncharacterized protein [Dermacentor albipictus]|uniref:uncharacterized protein n=1 Tax=Dermacentor albipictus TaxID=60249 RepID=UPI0031FBE249